MSSAPPPKPPDDQECEVEIIPPAAQRLTPVIRGTAAHAQPRGIRYFLSYVPGVPTLVALWLYMLDDEAPSIHKISIMLTFLYFLWPIDLIKDLFAGLGYLDDLAVFYGLVRFIGSEALTPYRREARRWLRGMPPINPEIAP